MPVDRQLPDGQKKLPETSNQQLLSANQPVIIDAEYEILSAEESEQNEKKTLSSKDPTKKGPIVKNKISARFAKLKDDMSKNKESQKSFDDEQGLGC